VFFGLADMGVVWRSVSAGSAVLIIMAAVMVVAVSLRGGAPDVRFWRGFWHERFV